MRLPNDVARCTGQPIGGAWKCMERDQCLRYLAYRDHPRGQPFIDDGVPIPLSSVLMDRPEQVCEFWIQEKIQ